MPYTADGEGCKICLSREIISGIAHEIKNPLTGISCAVQVFNSELSDDDSRKPVITQVLNQVNRLDTIVKGLLSYAKPKPLQFLPAGTNDVLERPFSLYILKQRSRMSLLIIRLEGASLK